MRNGWPTSLVKTERKVGNFHQQLVHLGFASEFYVKASQEDMNGNVMAEGMRSGTVGGGLRFADS